MVKCAMVKCSKPIGKKTPGVQCSRCNKWYHGLCASLSTEQLSALSTTESVDWKCKTCSTAAGGKPKRVSLILPEPEEDDLDAEPGAQRDEEKVLYEIRNEIRDMRQTVSGIKPDELQSSLKFYSEKIDEYEMKIQNYETRVKLMENQFKNATNTYKDLELKNDALEQKVNKIEQMLIWNEIGGITENKDENVKGIVIKSVIQQEEAGKFHEQIHIVNDSTGHSYKSLFGRFLDDHVQFVVVKEPYIRIFYQCQNFLQLCELLVKTCSNLRHLQLVTSRDSKSEGDQRNWLHNLNEDLQRYRVKLVVEYSETLHDRQITLSTGWIIKIGRGLHIFKKPKNQFCLGVYDLDLRQCHETTVDIVHSKNVKQSYGWMKR